MPEISGVMSFPGIGQIESGSFTLSHGISPSCAVLEILRQSAPITDIGTLRIAMVGQGIEIDFPECRVDQGSLHYNQSGLIFRVSIQDRRWQWKFGEIYGNYNIRLPDGSIAPETAQTPQQLAVLCFNAMGEPYFDVSQLPNDTFPEVNWEGDVPARELSQLAEHLGCRVVLGLDNIPRICRTGFGADLPTKDVEALNVSVNVVERPDSLKVLCGKTIYQPDFLLEAVGLDLDGTVKLINNLSYMPAGGWSKESPLHDGFWGVSALVDATTGLIPQQLARDTVFRWYRISMTAADNANLTPLIPGWSGGSNGNGRINFLWQILPIQHELAGGYYDINNVWRALPAQVIGQYYDKTWTFTNTAAGTFYWGGYKINKEWGQVEFHDALFLLNADNTVSAANIGLRTAVNVLDPFTFAPDRAAFIFQYPDQVGTGARILKHDEMILRVIPQYDTNHNLLSFSSNLSDLQQQANYYLAAADLSYQTKNPKQVTYSGIIPISPDGAIQQVSWHVGPQGAHTEAGRNNEYVVSVPPYQQRLLADQLRNNQIQQITSSVKELKKKVKAV